MSANRMQNDDGISDSTRKVSLKISLELKHSTIRATIVLVRTFFLKDIFSKFIIWNTYEKQMVNATLIASFATIRWHKRVEIVVNERFD